MTASRRPEAIDHGGHRGHGGLPAALGGRRHEPGLLGTASVGYERPEAVHPFQKAPVRCAVSEHGALLRSSAPPAPAGVLRVLRSSFKDVLAETPLMAMPRRVAQRSRRRPPNAGSCPPCPLCPPWSNCCSAGAMKPCRGAIKARVTDLAPDAPVGSIGLDSTPLGSHPTVSAASASSPFLAAACATRGSAKATPATSRFNSTLTRRSVPAQTPQLIEIQVPA